MRLFRWIQRRLFKRKLDKIAKTAYMKGRRSRIIPLARGSIISGTSVLLGDYIIGTALHDSIDGYVEISTHHPNSIYTPPSKAERNRQRFEVYSLIKDIEGVE